MNIEKIANGFTIRMREEVERKNSEGGSYKISEWTTYSFPTWKETVDFVSTHEVAELDRDVW